MEDHNTKLLKVSYSTMSQASYETYCQGYGPLKEHLSVSVYQERLCQLPCYVSSIIKLALSSLWVHESNEDLIMTVDSVFHLSTQSAFDESRVMTFRIYTVWLPVCHVYPVLGEETNGREASRFQLQPCRGGREVQKPDQAQEQTRVNDL